MQVESIQAKGGPRGWGGERAGLRGASAGATEALIEMGALSAGARIALGGSRLAP